VPAADAGYDAACNMAEEVRRPAAPRPPFGPPTGRPPPPVAALPAAHPAPHAASPAPCALHRALRRERGGMAAVCSQRRSCAVRAGARPGARPAHRHHRLADNRGRPGATGGPAWHRPASGAAARLT